MEYAYRLMRNVKYFYNTMNPATLSGAIDVIVVEQPDGTYLSTPFHCRFGKYGVFNSDEKYVDITINGVEIDLQMKLGENGIAFFVETTEEDDIPEYLVTSPLPDAPCPETDKVLAESAKVLKRQQRSETRARIESKRSQHNLSESSSISRSPSPVNRLLKPSKTDRNPSPRTERRSSLRKLKLPFSSSVFSSRRYRSLPDLSAVVQSTESGEHSPQSSKLKHSRSTVLKRSLSKPPSDRRQPKVTFSIVPDALSGSIPEKRPKRDNSLNESEDERSSTSSDQRQKESSSYEDRSRIADGALSDSEVDRQRNLPAGNDVSVWNWGQIPDSTTDTKPKKSAEEKKQESGYSWWFGWRRKSAPKAEPEEQQGIYLDDLTNDPEKMEKYLGTSLQDTRVDSGNGSIASPVPASPTELSPATLEEMVTQSDDEKTPTTEKVQPPSASSIENGLMKADVVEAQLLAGTTSSENAAEIEVSSTSSGERKQRHVSGASSASDSAVVSNDEGFNSDSVPYSRIRFIRSLRLPSDKLKKLGLKYGSNEARFSITTKFQGTSWCSCHIYLYKWNERLVISDIDGTITKSDVLGHVIPAIGGDWAHAGVAELYTRIKNNGYNLIYLSSRAIGQSHYTKKYLQSVAQDSKVLPDGPVLLSPDSVLVAFRREVIERKPYEFKIAALSDLKNLFPVKQPFSAGFGNRDTDVKSYTAVGIPDERILIINPQGNLKRADSIGYVSSYESMAMETVDYLFPPLVAQDADDHIVSNADRSQKRVHLKPLFTKPEKFSSFTHWHIKPRETLQLTATDFADYDAEQAANQKSNAMEAVVPMEQEIVKHPKSAKKVTWSPTISVYMIHPVADPQTTPTRLSPSARRSWIQQSLGIVSDDEEEEEVLRLCGWDEDVVLVDEAPPMRESPKGSVAQRTYPPARKMMRRHSSIRATSTSAPPAPSTSSNSVASDMAPMARKCTLGARESFLVEFERELTLESWPPASASNENKENLSFLRNSSLLERAFNGDDVMDHDESSRESAMGSTIPNAEKPYDFWDDVTY